MISIDPTTQTERDNYKLLVGSIVPRPIALITSQSTDGVLNAAPFSYFSIVSSDPPRIAVSIQRRQGERKDTARHAIERGAFVVHIVDESIVRAANETAASLPPEESEMGRAGLTPIASEAIAVPGIREAKIRMECVLDQAIELSGSDGEVTTDLIIGKVVRFHLAEEVYDRGRGYILAEKLNPVSRLAGSEYATLGRRFALERPH